MTPYHITVSNAHFCMFNFCTRDLHLKKIMYGVVIFNKFVESCQTFTDRSGFDCEVLMTVNCQFF